MNGLGVEETIEQLVVLHGQLLGALIERRQQRPAGSPTRLQEFALLALRDRGGMQVSEVVSLLEISPATTSQLLSVMEGKGWLQRDILPADRRRHQVTLTAAGRALVAEMETRRRERFARVLAELTALERADFVHLAKRLVEILAPSADSCREAF